MKRSKFVAVGAAILVACAQSAGAAVITYDEAVEGDLLFDGPYELFNFDVGVNTISGSSQLWDNRDPPTDRDPFGFVIPIGSYLASASIAFTTTFVGDDIDLLLATFAVDSGACPTCAGYSGIAIDVGAADLLLGSGSQTLWDDLAGTPTQLAAGSYFLGQSYNSGGGPIAYMGGLLHGAFDYTLSFNVVTGSLPPPPPPPPSTSVPEPMSLSLFALGLGALGIRVRRRLI